MSETARTALVTGASRGIGRAIALRLARLGWDLGLNYLRSRDAAESVRREIEKTGRSAALCQGDIGTAEGRHAALSAFRSAYSRIDALINNAGIAPRDRVDLLELDEAAYREVMSANLEGALFLSVEVARWMVELRRADASRPLHIINISSISEYATTPQRSQYCIAKAGIGMMTRLFADRLGEHGIQVNEVRPGIIATDMTAGVRDVYDRRIAEGLAPMRRWGTPEDVAAAVAAIVEGSFPFTTGAAFDVDGGFHIVRL